MSSICKCLVERALAFAVCGSALRVVVVVVGSLRVEKYGPRRFCDDLRQKIRLWELAQQADDD